MSEVFNLVWYNSSSPPKQKIAVARGGTHNLPLLEYRDAIILFPSLMTPLVVRENDAYPWLELLLVSKKPLTAEHVNRQLKIDTGLDAEKSYHDAPLFVGTGDTIELESASKETHDLLRTFKRFEGVLHAGFAKRMESAGFTQFSRVRVRIEALDNANAAHKPVRPAAQADDTTYRAETQDHLIKAMLEERHVLADHQQLLEKGQFGFRLSADGPQVWLDRGNPIQAYHPVYRFGRAEPEHLNFGHLTDIHVNGRLDMMTRTPVRVIDSKRAKDASQQIGEMVQPTNRSFTQLLKAMATSDEAHGLLIGGDLIDHQVNAYRHGEIKQDMVAVWDAVDVSEAGQKRGYVPGVDMISFWSLLIDFCRQSKKPVFGIAGNHDAYFKPFGISPRFLHMRANAGIPADVNLTLYEGVLAFGPSFADFTLDLIHDIGEARSSFKAEWMEWFYTVFTPFVEASVQLPKQRMVCMGWGDSEDMVAGGQGAFHLPRADNAVSEAQLALLKKAAADHATHKVVVLSHFTVASFVEQVPLLRADTLPGSGPGGKGKPAEGKLYTTGDEGVYNMGTFELMHHEFLTLLEGGRIGCVFSGHSHRRGLYQLGPRKTGYFPVTVHDPETFFQDPNHPKVHAPALIVSDSAGPYPRFNFEGEFEGWGSDQPSGSVAIFDAHGELDKVKVVRAAGGAKPRLAVALDYADLDRNLVWALPLQTAVFSGSGELRAQMAYPEDKRSTFYRLRVPLKPHLASFGLRVGTITFLDADSKDDPLVVHVEGKDAVSLVGDDNGKFFRWVKQTKVPNRFVSIVFDCSGNEAITSRYDLKSEWNFEVVTSRRGTTALPYYVIERPQRSTGRIDFPDLPDFDWRLKRHNARAIKR